MRNSETPTGMRRGRPSDF